MQVRFVKVAGLILVGAFLLAACHKGGTRRFVVTTTADGVDANPGDEICEMTPGLGDCSLRAAIDETNMQTKSNSSILLATGLGTVTLTVDGTGETANATGDLNITRDVTILGNGNTVDASTLPTPDRVMSVVGGATAAEIDGLTITGGNTTGSGGGVLNTATLTLTSSIITGNQADGSGGGVHSTGTLNMVDTTISSNGAGAAGGGIFVQAGGFIVGSSITGNGAVAGGGLWNQGVLQIADSTFSGNTASSAGGGIANRGDLAMVTSTLNLNTATAVRGGGLLNDSLAVAASLVNTTVSGNSAPSGGGISSDAPTGISITLTTVTSNTGGGLLATAGGTTTVAGSIIAGQTTGADCSGSTISGGYNIEAATTCGFSATGDQQNSTADLGTLQNNGGPTDTHKPGVASDALGAIPTGTSSLCDGSITTDQRGEPRPEGSACETGAVEATLFVTHGGDDTDSNPGDGVCQDAAGSPGACSLRAAIDEANAAADADTVSIDPSVGTVTLTRLGSGENANDTGDLDVTSDLTINGNGATITATAGLADRVLEVVGGATNADLNQVTITGGDVTGSGGGIFSAGSLTLVDSTIASNDASGSGGGIQSLGPLSLTRATVTSNTAGASGGGIYSQATSIITLSTLSANQAVTGGGLWNQSNLQITEANIRGNTASSAGGGIANRGDLILTSSTISGNTAAGVRGGGFLNDSLALSAVIYSSTISGNSAPSGAGLSSDAPTGMTIERSTITANTGGGILTQPAATTTLVGNIVASQAAGSDCSGPTMSSGYNVESFSSCGFVGVGDQQNTTVNLGPLRNNGGPTDTHLPLPGSAALDSIPAATASLCDGSNPLDQRGEPRPFNGACDGGATEAQT